MPQRNLTRRQALGGVAVTVAAGLGAVAAQSPERPASVRAGSARLVPLPDLVNAAEFEAQARDVLPAAEFARLAGGPRGDFDRITLHQRLMVPALDLDLSVSLFGDTHFAPLIVAPVEQQQRLHADAELATIRGASAARTTVVLSSHSAVNLADAVSASTTPVWFQVFASDRTAAARTTTAVTAGCRAICVIVGAAPSGAAGTRRDARVDWAGVHAVRQAAGRVPVLVAGITTSAMAAEAQRHDVAGLIVSDPRPGAANRGPLVLTLARVADAVAGAVPILTEGGYTRGSDVLKALASGARAVLVGRSVMWGLAAYGQNGVQTVLEILQSELARYMAMSGRPSVPSIDRSLLRVHAAVPAPEGPRG